MPNQSNMLHMITPFMHLPLCQYSLMKAASLPMGFYFHPEDKHLVKDSSARLGYSLLLQMVLETTLTTKSFV